jgi:hypothetical protein
VEEGDHNHPPVPEKDVVDAVRQDMRERAKNETTSVRRIYDDAGTNFCNNKVQMRCLSGPVIRADRLTVRVAARHTKGVGSIPTVP